MVQLTPTQVIEDKPFTHIGHNAADIVGLDTLRHRLRAMLKNMTDAQWDCQQHLEFIEDNGKGMRFIIVRPRQLLAATELTVVGFCGRKRHVHLHEQEEMAQVDAVLVAELCEHPDMLCYCSLETESGDWDNLVLMSKPEGIQHWRGSARHSWAVDSLTPRFYEHIRLHNGVLAHGLDSEPLVLTSTKYFDFSGTEPWRAIRQLL